MSHSEKPAPQPGKLIIVISIFLAITGWIQLKDIPLTRPASKGLQSALKSEAHCAACREAGPEACAEDFGEGKACGVRAR